MTGRDHGSRSHRVLVHGHGSRETRPSSCPALTAVLGLLLAILSGCSGTDPDVRPSNILLIVSEDNGPELGAYGDPYARTPVLDTLAQRGTLFKNAYVPQAGCSQSRAALLTGLYPHQNGQIGLATWRYSMYRRDTPNIVSRLKDAGYRTGIIGKLHINPEDAFPFDFAEIPRANFQRKDLGAYAAHASQFFEQSPQPFFLSVNYPDAHRPFLRQVAGLPEHPLSEEDVESLSYLGIDSPILRTASVDYLNSISRLDSLIGDLLEALEDSGEADRTLVVYLGDHGADLLRGKRTCYEGGLRIPLIVRWPGQQQAGGIRDELVSTIDLAPTLLAAAGAEAIPGLPGLSLAPLLRGEAPDWREHLFAEFHVHSNHNYYPQRSVRDRRYKLVHNLLPGEENPGQAFTVARFFGEGELAQALDKADTSVRRAYALMAKPPEFELYDLAQDPFEFRNLAGDPAHQAPLLDLQRVLLEWRERTSDPFLDESNVRRLKAEVDATFKNGEYQRPSGWNYRSYLAPEVYPWE